MSEYFFDKDVEEIEAEEGWSIGNDSAADWAVKKIAEENEEIDRLIAIAQNDISRLNERIMEYEARREKKTGFLKSKLWAYFQQVKTKETKTQQSYELLSGKLVYKKPARKMIPNKEMLIAKCKADGMIDYIKTKEELDWANYKKFCDINGDNVVDVRTGEVIEGIEIEDVPGSFDIK